ncbi:MAG: phosphodiester glycosidase family protein [Thermoleophilia bacterium]|nr:phosphodiester glycosidase family protein [Thermoleophilia bacterium]
MLRLVVLAAVVAALFAAPAVAAEPQTLVPGVTYERQLTFSRFGPRVLHVVTAPRPGGLYALKPVVSNNAVPGKETVTAMQRRLASSATIVGVNGDFASAEGVPAGVLVQTGTLIVDANAKRSSIGVDPDGTLRVERLALLATWQGRGQRRPLIGVNRRPGANGVSVYTSAWGPATPAEPGAVEAVFASLPPLRLSGESAGVVTAVRSGGGAAIPPGGGVLVARGTQAARLAEEARVGDEVTLRLVTNLDWSGVTDGLAGGPVLVRAGKAVFNPREDFSLAALSARTARVAVGQRADGRIVLVAADGGLPGFSAGLTNFELAQTLVRLGAVTAAALEGGPAATLAFDGKLLNRPSAGERPVSLMLGVLYEGVYAPPPEPVVLSPNGDGVDERQTFRYRVVRPSSVTVTLVDPAGAARTVEAAERPPGSYELPWTGRREDGTLEAQGRWRWIVTARDGQGRQSTAEHPFSLNTTLAGLRVAPAVVRVGPRGGVLSVSFTLAHGASWTATIETPRGTVLRRYARRSAAPGPASFTWDGRYHKRARAYSGQHVVRVSVTNEFGAAQLARPFTVRRVGR